MHSSQSFGEGASPRRTKTGSSVEIPAGFASTPHRAMLDQIVGVCTFRASGIAVRLPVERP